MTDIDSQSKSTFPKVKESADSPARVHEALAADALVVDVRDANERSELWPGAVACPINVNDQKQSEHATSLAEFQAALRECGVQLPGDRSAFVVTHCNSGGRGGLARDYLQQMGFVNAVNGAGVPFMRAVEAHFASR